MRKGKWLRNEELDEICGFGVKFCAHGESSTDLTYCARTIKKCILKSAL